MSRTQLRLQQVSGSFGVGSGQINDQIITAAAATGSINSSDLASVLSHMAASIKKIHGADSFTESAPGVFSLVDVSAGTLTLANDQISGDKVEGGTINATTINTLTSTDLQVTNLKANDGTSAGSIADSTGIVTLNSAVLTTADINGGTVDAADITVGASKTLDVSGGTLTTSNAQDLAILANGIANNNADRDFGAFDLRAQTLTADSLSSGLVLYTGASGVLSAEAGFSYDDVTDTLTVQNLNVAGTTTQVDTVNLNVADKNILINDGGAAASAGGAGIDIEENASVTGYFRVSSDRNAWEMKAPNNAAVATFDIDATKTITIAGALNIEADSAINQDVTSDASVIFADVTANGGVVVDDITIDGTAIALSSGDLTLDVAGDIILDAGGNEILLHVAGSEFGSFEKVSNDLVVSASVASAALILGSDAGVRFEDSDVEVARFQDAGAQGRELRFDSGASANILAQGGYQLNLGGADGGWVSLGLDDNSGKAYLAISGSGANSTILLGDNADGSFEGAGGVLSLSGSAIEFKGGASAFESRYYDIGESHYVGFKAPALSASQIWTLPDADGTANYALVTNGFGQLSWADPSGASLKKSLYKVTAQIAAGQVDFVSSPTAGISKVLGDDLDLSSIADAELLKKVEVYVNGALLISGSSGGADTDYTHVDGDSINFAFGLEADDIIQIIAR